MQFSAFTLIIIYFFLRIRNRRKFYIYQEKKYLCDPDMSFKAYIIYTQNDSMINEIIFLVNDNLSLFLFFLKKMKEN